MLAGHNLAQMYPTNQSLQYSNVNVKQEQRGFAGERVTPNAVYQQLNRCIQRTLPSLT